MKNRTKNLPFWANNPNNVLILKKEKPNLIYNLAKKYFSHLTLNCGRACVEDLMKLELKERKGA